MIGAGEAQARGVVLLINTDDREYPHYHQATDSIDHIDFGLMESMGRMVGAAAALHAGPSRAGAPSSSSLTHQPSQMVEADHEQDGAEDLHPGEKGAELLDKWIAALSEGELD